MQEVKKCPQKPQTDQNSFFSVQRSSVLDFIIFQYPRGMFPTNMDKGIRLVKELRETAGWLLKLVH